MQDNADGQRDDAAPLRSWRTSSKEHLRGKNMVLHNSFPKWWKDRNYDGSHDEDDNSRTTRRGLEGTTGPDNHDDPDARRHPTVRNARQADTTETNNHEKPDDRRGVTTSSAHDDTAARRDTTKRGTARRDATVRSANQHTAEPGNHDSTDARRESTERSANNDADARRDTTRRSAETDAG